MCSSLLGESSLSSTGRECLVSSYDCMTRSDLDSFSGYLKDISNLVSSFFFISVVKIIKLLYVFLHQESEVGHLPQRWRVHWRDLKIPPSVPPREPASLVQIQLPTYERGHEQMLHKRSTIDLLWRSKMGIGGGKIHFCNFSFSSYFMVFTLP